MKCTYSSTRETLSVLNLHHDFITEVVTTVNLLFLLFCIRGRHGVYQGVISPENICSYSCLSNTSC